MISSMFYILFGLFIIGVGSYQNTHVSREHITLDSRICSSHWTSRLKLQPRRSAHSNSLKMKFEFHEAQQSHEYNVGKVQRGYYSADPDGKVDKVIDRVMTQHMLDKKNEEENELPLDEDDTLKYMPSLDLSDPIVSSMIKVCKVEEVTGFEMLDSRWNGNEGSKPFHRLKMRT